MIRLLNGIALLVAITLAVALYIAKTEAKSSQERLELIQAQLAEERRQVNVLNVEIAHLEEPERLRALAKDFAGNNELAAAIARQDATQSQRIVAEALYGRPTP